MNAGLDVTKLLGFRLVGKMDRRSPVIGAKLGSKGGIPTLPPA